MASDAKSKISFQLIVAVIGSLILGIVIGLASSKALPTKTSVEVDEQKSANSKINQSIFADESALIRAKVSQISPNSITVNNAENIEATFKLNDQISISEQPGSGKPAVKASTENIKVGEFVIINLKKISGEYQVQSIVIPPPIGTIPPPPPLPSPKASAN